MNISPRPVLKAQTRELLRSAQVSPKAFTAVYCAISLALTLLDYFVTTPELAGIFVTFFSKLAGWVLAAGFALYCMGIRRRERMELATVLDGLSFAGKIILLNIMISLFTSLWGMLFVIPGFIAYYRYRFALYNLYDDPDLDIMAALEMSKRQTRGMKLALLKLDLSYAGWVLLGLLPSLLFDLSALLSVGGDPYAFLSTATPLWQIIAGTVWSSLMAIFYLPNYQCVLLDYFDAAKGAAPAAPSAWDSSQDDQSGF